METPYKYRLFKSLSEPYEYVCVGSVEKGYYAMVIYRKTTEGTTKHDIDDVLTQSTRSIFRLQTGCIFTMAKNGTDSFFVDRSDKSTTLKEVTEESFEDVFGKPEQQGV